MITVRYPTGFSVQYNTGWTIKTSDSRHDIVDVKGNWLASVDQGGGAIIENVSPCRTYHAGDSTEMESLRRRLDRAKATIRRLKGKK